jgi:hypothetical protein
MSPLVRLPPLSWPRATWLAPNSPAPITAAPVAKAPFFKKERRLLRVSNSDGFIIVFYFSELQTVELITNSLLSILNGDSIYSRELSFPVTGATNPPTVQPGSSMHYRVGRNDLNLRNRNRRWLSRRLARAAASAAYRRSLE